MALKNLQDTIVALSTAPGEAAIAVVRLSGDQSIQILNRRFSGIDLNKADSHTLHLGKIKNRDGSVLDEVVVGIYRAPRSYTGEDVLEISCHGSNYIVQRLIEQLIQDGARLAEPGEFTLRAFLNGKMDLSQAEAVADLIASESESSHDLAINQMKGGVSKAITGLRQELIEFASLLELELDFSEEDVEFADRKNLKSLITRMIEVVRKLLHSFRLGNALKKGITTVIAGKPNAGKSTLLNALLDEERAIVSEIPGTTRDTIEEILNIKGVLFRLVDTAGLRTSEDIIETKGVRRAEEKIEKAALLVYVFDVIETPPELLFQEINDLISKLKFNSEQVLFLANKMDLNPYTEPESYYKEDLINKQNLIPISAKNQMNIEYLKEKLFQLAIGEQIPGDQSMISSNRHFEALNAAHNSLTEAFNGLENNISSELVALDIRKAIHHLGEITGEISTDDLLESIFSNFCIGK